MLLQDKKWIFQNELLEMKGDGFIDEETYDNLHKVSNEFYDKKSQSLNGTGVEHRQNSYKQSIDRSIPITKRKVVSEQQLAERKTSILLNLGVVFLFLSGLIFATTNWDSLGAVGKILSIIFMGGILYAGSHVAETKLKLQKTGFALWVLTTLYIPIGGITILYSQMWSNGVAIDNTKSLLYLGLIGIVSTICNALSFKKYDNRYYMWASYITSELSILLLAMSFYISGGKIALILVLCSGLLLYVYTRLKRDDYKRYTRHYLMGLNEITLLILSFMSNEVAPQISFVIALIIMSIIVIGSSYKLSDKYIGMIFLFYIPLETLHYVVGLKFNIALFLIPAIIALGMQYLSHKGKLDILVGYMAVGTILVVSTLAMMSNTIFYVLGVGVVGVSALLLYNGSKLPENKFIRLNKYPHIILPLYTYILMVRLPFVLFDIKYTAQTTILGISAIILCIIQYVISDKYGDIKQSYSIMGMMMLILNGFNGISSMYLTILLFVALCVFEVFGLSKKLNRIAYIANIVVGYLLIYKISENSPYVIVITIAVLIGVVASMLVIAYVNKADIKYILLCTALFIEISLIAVNRPEINVAIIIIAIIVGAISVKEEASNALLILSLTVACAILLIFSNTHTGVPVKETMVVVVESLLAVALSVIGSKFYKEFKEGNKYDSLTLSSIIIVSILTCTIAHRYGDIAITTTAMLCIIATNYKKLSNSVILKLFLVLKLIVSYIQVITLSEISIGDGILIIPLLAWAISSRYYIFKDKKIGYVLERISLSALVLKLIANVMNFDTISAMVVISIGIIVLVISYSKRVKVYFTTSIAMVVLPLIKGTLDFWTIIPWWVYLLIVGIILLTMGSIAERNKKGNKSLKDLKDKFFKDWN
jgi:hypothetical protein